MAFDFVKGQIIAECKCEAHLEWNAKGKLRPCQIARTVGTKTTLGRPIGELVAWILMEPPASRKDHVFAERASPDDRVDARAFFEGLPGGAAWAALYEAPGDGEPE